jgi:hypothetical protein
MIHYTNALTHLIHDIVERVDAFSFIDAPGLLVFARVGRTAASGAYATCHSLNLPTSEPGYYYWRDRETGAITKRTEYFVAKTPEVWIGQRRLDYLISFSIPRYCDQVMEGSKKARFYRRSDPWLAKLDTVVHELYHISPREAGLRRFERPDGKTSGGSHSPGFLEEVAGFVHQYLGTRPDVRRFDFLRYDFDGLVRRFGGVAGTTFRNYPSYPQRYVEAVTGQAACAGEHVIPIARSSQPCKYDENDLQLRAFIGTRSRKARESELITAA